MKKYWIFKPLYTGNLCVNSLIHSCVPSKLFFNLKLTIKPLGLTIKLANNYTPGGNLYDEAKYDLNYYE